jgi:hypothetical protein
VGGKGNDIDRLVQTGFIGEPPRPHFIPIPAQCEVKKSM